jgi:adenosylcobinamide-phosphate synthase
VTRSELAAACALDALAGDPSTLPHPVQAIGAVIAAADARRRVASPLHEGVAGGLLALSVVAVSAALGALAGRAGPAIRCVTAASTLSARSLLDAVARVARALEADDLTAARAALAPIVGRDVDALDASGVARGALETLAESFSDGVVAPLLALRAGGCGAAIAFKAVSTLDSMIGHREPPHRWFGLVAARADDVANLIPARCAALAIAVAAVLTGDDPGAALRIAVRDAHTHASPNAGWPEAALAGALGVRLGGTNIYAGVAVTGGAFNASAAPPEAGDVRRGLWLVAVAIGVLELAVIASAAA